MKNGKLIAAWGEKHGGPGWANQTVSCLYIRDDGRLEIETLQPDEMGYDAAILFSVSAAVNFAMVSAIENIGRFEHTPKDKHHAAR